MPATLSHPGVYIEEIPSGVRTITGVATSITAFVGRAVRGPTDDPVLVGSWAEFERRFGGLNAECPMSYAVCDFYANGGSQALIVRIAAGGRKATILLDGPGSPGRLTLEASSVGAWGNRLSAAVDHSTDDSLPQVSPSTTDPTLFNLKVQYQLRVGGEEFATESFPFVSTDEKHARYLPLVLERQSSLVRVKDAMPGERPNATTNWVDAAADSGADGSALKDDDLIGAGKSSAKAGLYALNKADLFNLLCIPPIGRDLSARPGTWKATSPGIYGKALELCVERRAMLIVDPDPSWGMSEDTAVSNAIGGVAAWGLSGTATRNAAVYFPCVTQVDSKRDDRIETFVPCGIVAGIMARTDTARGVWKAPAGLDAALNGVQGLQVKLDDFGNGRLNQLGINCLRSFPVNGRVVWGARTMRGADQHADEYKYVPVRRLALYIEESLYRGTQWVVFEPNDEPLWGQIRLAVGAFMQNLFRQGAFQGKSAREAYLVKCDGETTTQNDINLGIVNILVGFAPLKPAEFVVIKIQQLAGQVQT